MLKRLLLIFFTMGRAPCCDKEAKVKKGPWTPDEDLKLVAYIQEHGHGSWRALPEKAGLARCGKSCRLRWTNYLRPDIKRGRFSHEEEQTIFQLHAILGNRWSAIASRLPRRTDNEIKNYWNTHLKKRLNQVGIGPFTSSSPKQACNLQELLTSSWTPLVPSRLTHMTQWDLTVAEAQARLRPKPTAAEAQAPAKVHPSAFFMRSWKTEVEHTLTPKFGTVKLEPSSLKSAGSNLQGATTVVEAQSCVGGTVPMTESLAGRDCIFSGSDLDGLDHVLSSGSVLGASSIGTAPMTEESGEGRSGSVLDGFDAQNHVFALDSVIADVCMGTEEDSGEGRSGICSGSVLGDQISPTSILHGPESYTDVHSPCGSTNSGTTSDCFDLILHQSSSYHKFPVILDQPEPSSSTTTAADTFWDPERQQAALMEALEQPESLLLADAGSESGLESIIPLDFDEAEFPPFESLCQEAEHYQADQV